MSIGSSIPFQPGLALGSIIRLNTLEQQNEQVEANRDEKMQICEKEYERLEEDILKCQTKIAARLIQKSINIKNNDAKWEETVKKSNDALVVSYRNALAKLELEKTKLGQEIIGIYPELTSLEDNNPVQGMQKKVDVKKGFQQGIVSPLDMGASRIETQPRSSESLDYSSEYIKMDSDITEIYNHMKQSSHASSISGGGGAKWGPWKAGVSLSNQNLDAAADRLFQIHKEKKSEGVLVINAMMTTRYVRCFTNLEYDASKLRNILEVMKTNDAIELERHGISVVGTRKEIYLLTEAVLGGSFTALVTFMHASKNKQQGSGDAGQKENRKGVEINAEGVVWHAHSDYSSGSGNASQGEEDIIRNASSTRVKIEIFAKGAIPTFSRNIIETEVIKHLNINPNMFELSKMDEKDVETMVTATGQKRQVAIEKQRLKTEKCQNAFLNTYRGLASGKNQQKIHTLESVMDAYDDFAEKMTEDSGCGVPIGFNYDIYTEERIKGLLNIKEESSEDAKKQIEQLNQLEMENQKLKEQIRQMSHFQSAFPNIQENLTSTPTTNTTSTTSTTGLASPVKAEKNRQK